VSSASSSGAIPSPNIWDFPEIYEIENRAVDPDRVIEAAIGELVTESRAGLLGPATGWGQVLDIGAERASTYRAWPRPPTTFSASNRAPRWPRPRCNACGTSAM
jgi:hypothetical protein